MSRDFRGERPPAPTARKRPEEQPRFIKVPSKTRRQNELKHAVTHADSEAFEDYDEWDPKLS
jgi:hypothetical protein